MSHVASAIDNTIRLLRDDATHCADPSNLFVFSEQTRHSLLRGSLQYAYEHIPFYQRHCVNGVPNGITVLPIVDRELFVGHREDFLNRDLTPSGRFVCTGGTTKRERVVITYSKEELALIRQFEVLSTMVIERATFNAQTTTAPTIKLQTASRRVLSAPMSEESAIVTYLLDLHFPPHLLGYDFYDHIMKVLFQRMPTAQGLGHFTQLISIPPFVVRALTE